MAVQPDFFTGLFLANTTNNPGTVTLPLAADMPGRTLTVKDAAGTANTNPLTIQTAGSDLFEDGSTTLNLNLQHSFVTLTAGSNASGNPVWYITGGNQVSTIQANTLVLSDEGISQPTYLTVSSGYLLADTQFISTNYNSNFPTSFSGDSIITSSLVVSSLTVSSFYSIDSLNIINLSTVVNPAFSTFQLFDNGISTFQTISLSNNSLYAGANPVVTGVQVLAPEYFNTSSITTSSLTTNSITTSYRFPLQTIHFSSSPFSPSSITNMAAWFDAADPNTLIVDSGCNVSEWKDKSPLQQSLLQAIPLNDPIYVPACNSVQFNATYAQYLSNSYPNTYNNLSSFSLFSVLDTPLGPSALTFAGILSGIPIEGNDYNAVDGYAFTLGSGTDFQYSLANQYGNPSNYILQNTSNLNSPLQKAIREFIVDGTTLGSSYENATAFQANVSSSGGTSPGTSPQGLLMGARLISGTIYSSEFLTGNMYEVLLYNENLSDTDRQKVEGYLAWKWGLQTSLPLRHPYRFVSP